MFIVNLTYIKPLDEVEKFLEKHIDFWISIIQKVILSHLEGKNPRTGGIILMRAKIKMLSKESLHTIHSIKMRLLNMRSLNLKQVSIVQNWKPSSAIHWTKNEEIK